MPTTATRPSAATRAAIESVVFAPPSVLPSRGVAWRAETDNVIVARFDLPPERPEVRVRIDEHGAIRTVSALRWGNAGEKTFRYIPFGGEIHAERRFGDLVLPSSASVGWWFDTPRYAPFCHAEITAVTPPLQAAGRTPPRSLSQPKQNRERCRVTTSGTGTPLGATAGP